MRFRDATVAGMLMALVCATPAMAKDTPPPDPQEKPLQAALSLMASGRAAEALAAIDPVLAAYAAQYAGETRQIYCGATPPETLAYMMIAASEKKSAIAITPNWCSALFVKGFALIDQKRVEEGLPFLLRAVAMAPYHAHYLNELGYAYQALRRWPESLDAYSRAAGAAAFAVKAEQPVEQRRAWRGSGFVLVEQGKWDEAATMYRKCLTLDPNDTTAKGELHYIAQNRPQTR